MNLYVPFDFHLFLLIWCNSAFCLNASKWKDFSGLLSALHLFLKVSIPSHKGSLLLCPKCSRSDTIHSISNRNSLSILNYRVHIFSVLRTQTTYHAHNIRIWIKEVFFFIANSSSRYQFSLKAKEPLQSLLHLPCFLCTFIMSINKYKVYFLI